MKSFLIVLIAVIALSAKEKIKKDTVTIVNCKCDTTVIVITSKDTTITTKRDTLKTVIPKAVKPKKEKKKEKK